MNNTTIERLNTIFPKSLGITSGVTNSGEYQTGKKKSAGSFYQLFRCINKADPGSRYRNCKLCIGFVYFLGMLFERKQKRKWNRRMTSKLPLSLAFGKMALTGRNIFLSSFPAQRYMDHHISQSSVLTCWPTSVLMIEGMMYHLL